jgi:histone H3/H4
MLTDMSDVHEIEFETIDSPNWPGVKDGAIALGRTNLQYRYNAAVAAAEGFKADAHQLVNSTITKPPGHVSAFSAIVDVVMAACEIVIPEEAAIHLVYQAAKAAWEEVKPSAELLEKANEQIEANTVEEATKHLNEVSDRLAEDIVRNASHITEKAGEQIEAALVEYVRQNPQVFQREQAYYQTLCDAVGLQKPDVDRLADEMINKVMPKFREKVMETSASLHFFHELSSDFERLNFLIEITEKGTDPDAFLKLIGGDQHYWDEFLSVYRSEGKDAAARALAHHLGLPL